MDIAITWDARNLRGDWSCTPGDLALDSGGLRSAVLLSLFTDRVAPPDYLPPAGSSAERRGWWADSFEDSEIGSRLWLLNRSKKSAPLALLADARDYCLEALQWLQDSNVVQAVEVSAVWLAPTVMGLDVTLTQPTAPPQTFRFGWAWQGA